MPKSFDLQRLAQVIRTDATVTGQADFLATHTPFNNLKYVYSGITSINPKIVNEDGFLQSEILDKKDLHQFVVVQGDNGTGKSHLIRWLKEKYISRVNTAEEVVLFISRYQNTLRGALEQIIESNIFPHDHEINEIKKLSDATQHLSGDTLKKNIILNFALAAQAAHEEKHESELERRYVRHVYNFLTDETIQTLLLRNTGPIERIRQRLNPDESNERKDDIKPRFFAQDLEIDTETLNQMKRVGASKSSVRLAEDLWDSSKGPALRKKLAVFLNQYIEFVVQNCTSLRAADLKAVFEQLRAALKQEGKQLTLFIEDITSFVGLNRALVEVLVTEHIGDTHNDKFCRLISVVGSTNEFYETSFPDNLKERVTARIFIGEDTFKGKEDFTEMAARYMNALNLRLEDLNNWLDKGASENDLPISDHNIEHTWALYKLPCGREVSLFPFNTTALHKLYSALPAKTPRRFLQDVINHVLKLYNFYAEINEFPPSISDLEGEFRIPQWKDTNHERVVNREAGPKSKGVISLLRLWGDGTAFSNADSGGKTVGRLTEEVFKSFGLPFIGGVKQGKFATPVSTNGEDKPVKEPYQKPEEKKSEEKAKGRTKFEKLQVELEEWVNGGKLASYGELRDNVRNLLIEFIDWESEGVPGELVSNVLTTKRVSIEGQIGKFNKGFQVPRNKEVYYALLAIAAWRHLGERSWDFEGAGDHLAYLHNWLLNIKDKVISSVNSPEIVGGSTFEYSKWNLLSQFYVQAIFGGLKGSSGSLEDIYKRIFCPCPDIEVQENRSESWRALQKRFKNLQSAINKSHASTMSSFNCIQGSITQESKLFIDAVPALEILSELRSAEWSANLELSTDTLSDIFWHQPLKIIKAVEDVGMDNVIAEEMQLLHDLTEKLKEFAGDDFTNETIQEIFTEMKHFFTTVLVSANETYRDKDYRPLLDNVLTAKKLTNRLKVVSECLELKTAHQKLLKLSAHPAESIKPYLQLLNLFDKLLDEKANKFQRKLKELKEQSGDVDTVIESTIGRLEEMKKGFNID